MKGFGYLFSEGVKSVWNNRAMSMASIGILVTCLLITGAAVLFCQNLQILVDEIGNENITTIFLDFDLKSDKEAAIKKQLESNDNVESVSFYPKEEGIKELQDSLDSLENIKSEFQGDNNPLPDAYKITMKDLSKYEKTADEISKISGVLQVSNKKDWVQRFTQIKNFVAVGGFWVVLVLGLVSLFIVSTAIRTTMHSRRFEISIMKSVGATNSFVRIPFIVEGISLGVLSGIVGSILLKFVYEGIGNALESGLSRTIAIIDFNSVVGYVFLGMVLFGAAMGAIGAAISIRKYLKLEGNELLGW